MVRGYMTPNSFLRVLVITMSFAMCLCGQAVAMGPPNAPRRADDRARYSDKTDPAIELSLRIDTPDGVLLVTAALSEELIQDPTGGHVALWRGFNGPQLLVYGQLLVTSSNLGEAVLALGEETGIDLTALKDSPRVLLAIDRAEDRNHERGSWLTASRGLVYQIMGFPPPKEDAEGEIAGCIPPPLAVLPDPSPKSDERDTSDRRLDAEPAPHVPLTDPLELFLLRVLQLLGWCPEPCEGENCYPPGGGGCSCCPVSTLGGAASTADGSVATCCPTGTGCDDGNPCTVGDACGVNCGLCCGTPIECHDGNPCTEDECQNGVCVYSPIGCPDDGNPCTNDVCANGLCTHPPANGAPCPDDGNMCTNDVCSGSSCTHPHANGVICADDGNLCTQDVCSGGFCTHPPDNGAPCPDDGNECTDDRCNNYVCTHPPLDGTSCEDDGDPCTLDVCRNGGCRHEDISGPACEDDGDPCTRDVCNNGTCTHPPWPGIGPECEDDGNECTDDVCEDGVCTHPEKVCDDDGDVCTTASCCPGVGCTHANCCDDGDVCTTDYCDPLYGNPCAGWCGNYDVWPHRDSCSEVGCQIEINAPPMLFVNDDDDNRNSIPDLEEAGPVSGENDLEQFQIVHEGCPPSFQQICNGLVLWGLFGPSMSFFHNPDKTAPLGSIAPACGLFVQDAWPPPNTGWIQASLPSQGCASRLVLRLAGGSGPDCQCGCCVCWCDCIVHSIGHVLALRVTSLEWQQKAQPPDADGCREPVPGNAGLDLCPNNRGQRVFPDAIFPGDPSPQLRRQVDLVAAIQPAVPGVTVYFKVWDVDDPFDQRNPSMPSVGLIDDDTAGPDNRLGSEATDPAVGTYQAMTDIHGRARVTVTVSMQPGNNYRAGASVIPDARDQVSQAMVDALNQQQDPVTGATVWTGSFSGYKVPLVWSKMLTVWRKLHVEVDSMSAEPQTLTARSPDWDEFDAITVLGGTDSAVFTGVGVTNGPGLAAGEVDHYEGGPLTYTIPSREYLIRSNHVFWDGSATRTEIRADGVLAAGEEADILTNIGVVRDDDPLSGQLPLLYSLGADPFIKSAYLSAYIELDQDDTLNPRRLVTFDLHLNDLELQTGVGYDNLQDLFSQNAFWASLVVLAHQPDGPMDADPDPVPNSGSAPNPNYDAAFDFGVTIEDSDNASVVYVEVNRDLGGWAGKDLSHTIAHEVGHSAGPANDSEVEHDEGGLMTAGAPAAECCFSAKTLRRFRETIKW